MFTHRKLTIFFLLVIVFGARDVLAQVGGFRNNSTVIQNVIDRASFEFSNESMYRDQNKWIGETIAFRGTITRYPNILNTDKPYEECSGSNSNNDPVDFIVFFDAPLLSQTVTTAEVFRVFGIVQKCREVITRTGNVRVLPVLELLLVYRVADQTFRFPVWVSTSLRN